MTNKKGQALVEAVFGLGSCILFFACCLKLWMTAVAEIKDEQLAQQKQICELSRLQKCEGGFVLMTTLLQLTVILFAGQILWALMTTNEYRWNMMNWCFEGGLQALTDSPSSFREKLQNLDIEKNKLMGGLLHFESKVIGPIISNNSTNRRGSENLEATFDLTSKISSDFKFNFFKTRESQEQIKCGAKKICEEQKCSYSLVVDKS